MPITSLPAPYSHMKLIAVPGIQSENVVRQLNLERIASPLNLVQKYEEFLSEALNSSSSIPRQGILCHQKDPRAMFMGWIVTFLGDPNNDATIQRAEAVTIWVVDVHSKIVNP